ncbi:MAG: hypothetical protein QW478_05675 [Candidatus Micrarchaeaceae archaeon]
MPCDQIKGREQPSADLNQAGKVIFRQIFMIVGYVKTLLFKLMTTWFFYSSSFILMNMFVFANLVEYYHWSAMHVATLLLISGGVGFFFYPLGGIIGEMIERKDVLIISGVLTPILGLVFILNVYDTLLISIIYFFVYKVMNGTGSGVGYTYWAEVFPTKVRRTIRVL